MGIFSSREPKAHACTKTPRNTLAVLWLESETNSWHENQFPLCFPHTITAELWHFRILGEIWAAPSEFGTYRLCEQRRFRRACASAQSRQNLRCSLIQAVSQEEPSDGKPDPWPLWMAGHAQLKFVMTECSKTQIRLARLIFKLGGTNSGHNSGMILSRIFADILENITARKYCQFYH